MTPRATLAKPDPATLLGAWALVRDAVRAYRAARAWTPGNPAWPRPEYGKRPYDVPIRVVVAYHLIVKPLGLALWLLVLIGGLSLAQKCGVRLPRGFLP